MQHAECAYPKAIHSTISIPYHTYGNLNIVYVTAEMVTGLNVNEY